MPSIRKRIGYLPSINIQEIITKISNKEKLSQSKVVDILVEEALVARGLFDHENTADSIRKSRYKNLNNYDSSSLKNNELDELISDKGITYNTKKYKPNLDNILSERSESYIEELFEQFKQFIIFQKMIQKR
tara:strand:+ start:178 stop:573 length:396 start_codon:yes stop_codon:yes gene_type:complete